MKTYMAYLAHKETFKIEVTVDITASDRIDALVKASNLKTIYPNYYVAKLDEKTTIS